VKLDFEQRQEAEKLLEQAAGNEDVMRELIYELIAGRGMMKQALDWIRNEDMDGDPDDLYSGRVHRVAALTKIFTC
jgi:hypothetical protein